MRRVIPLLLLLAAIAPADVARAADYTKITDVRIAMSDGVRLAADVYVPTVADGDGDGLYPCVVELTPYRKENRATEGASYLPAQGIALIEVDARGTGGSAGEYDIVFSVREQQDAVEWIDWASTSAKKPDGSKLCEEKVGMYGGSYSGIIQYLVASLPLDEGDSGFGTLPAGSPHLAAIAPQRAYGDLYRDIVYHGGMVINSFGEIWSAGTTAYYTQPPADMPSADAVAAWNDHLTKNDPLIPHYLDRPYADAMFTSNATTPAFTQKIYDDSSVLSRIENLRTPTLHLAGFFDAFTRGQLRTFQEVRALEGDGRGPNFLIVGPWNHTGTHFITPDQGFKQRLGDWYRTWLESAPAAAWMSGPRVTYFQMKTGKVNAMTAADGEWRTADSWPPPIASVETIRLVQEEDQFVGYAYNPAGGAAETWSRWDNAAGIPVPQQQWDQRLETGGVSFFSHEFSTDLQVAGPIGVHLVASTVGLSGDPSQASSWPGALQATPPYHDTDFVVKVSDVAPDGTTTLVTEGFLRASHRAIDPAKSFSVEGKMLAPYHPHTLATLEPPPADGTPQGYEIEVWPVAKTWQKGHQVRVDVMSSDTPNHLALMKPALNGILWGSTISLPVVN